METTKHRIFIHRPKDIEPCIIGHRLYNTGKAGVVYLHDFSDELPRRFVEVAVVLTYLDPPEEIHGYYDPNPPVRNDLP